MDKDDLVLRLRGRAGYKANLGHAKDAAILSAAAQEIEALRGYIERQRIWETASGPLGPIKGLSPGMDLLGRCVLGTAS